MKRYIGSVSRDQGTLFPVHLDDWIDDENAVRVIDAFVEELDLPGLGFELAEATGRPGYHPSVLLKLYIYGYLNRVQSSRRLERETLRNVEVMWLLGRLSPDHKTIADFRKDNGDAIRKVCAQRSVCLLSPAWRSMVRSSKRSTIGIGTSPRPRCSGGRSRSRRAYRVI